jgi:hypothetical protein
VSRHRQPNGSGYVRRTQLASGELRYEARLRNKYIGTYSTRALAERAIEEERQREPEGAEERA